MPAVLAIVEWAISENFFSEAPRAPRVSMMEVRTVFKPKIEFAMCMKSPKERCELRVTIH